MSGLVDSNDVRSIGPGSPRLAGGLGRRRPGEVQAAATNALAEFKEADLASAMFANWSRYSRKTRSQLLTTGVRTTLFTNALLDALERGRIAQVEIDAYTRITLLKIQN